MKTVAIILARGGSKRIPRKNIKLFAGKPIIGYSIEAAIASGIFYRIIVSTDDEEIASVAQSFGAEVPFTRPAELSDDFTTTNDVVKHAIDWLQNHGEDIQYACCIYATAPFIQAKYLRQGLEQLKTSGKSYTFSVTSFPFPIQRAVRINKAGFVEVIYPENIFKRSQDLEETYHDAGQFYWGKTVAFLNDIVTYSTESVPIILPRYLVHDIDTPEDWQRAELIFTALQNYKVTDI
jgi:pseudaminic acid cytidylyltransferase